jgi:hypothetical protein
VSCSFGVACREEEDEEEERGEDGRFITDFFFGSLRIRV